MFYPFSVEVLDISDLEVLDFWLFSYLVILDWFSTWHIKYTRIPMNVYFKKDNFCMCMFSVHLFVILLHCITYPMQHRYGQCPPIRETSWINMSLTSPTFLPLPSVWSSYILSYVIFWEILRSPLMLTCMPFTYHGKFIIEYKTVYLLIFYLCQNLIVVQVDFCVVLTATE